MNIDFAEYRLSTELRGHEDDVRGICVCGSIGIATSSRDMTIRFWTPDQSNGRDYATSKLLLGHTSFVVPIAWIAPNEELPEGGVVSGGMDTLVKVWDVRSGEAVYTMRGHTFQVTGIVLDGDDILSSSVDCSIRRWRKGQVVDVWDAHKAAIQAIIKLPSGEFVTGSSDTTLKLWRGKTCVHTFVGHTDTVRSLAVMPDLGVLSASHDGSIRLWATSGEVLLEMVGHTSIIYSVDSNPSGLIVSGSEDCSAKIWKDGVCVQSLEHPGCVWDAKFLESGDIVTACSDEVVRVWTVNHDKIADSTLLESFSTQLSHYKISRKKVGGIKLEDLPGLEALQVPGTSDGQTKIVREGDNGVAYTWNLIEQKWDKIGEVVDGPDDNLKQRVLDGIQYESYDHVFIVDVGDGEPIRKLPYNRSDNPYDTADKWVAKENLPLSYRPKVAEFILQNTGQRDFTLDALFRDHTGASAYVPGESSKKYDTSAKPAFKHIPKIGEVVDGPDDNLKQPVLDGIQYDHVFNVDVGDGEPIRKLPYNRSDNPYDTADKWVAKENLPLSYRLQVAEFILQNTGQSDFTLDALFRDHTGASAYVPGESSKKYDTSAKPAFKHIPKIGEVVDGPDDNLKQPVLDGIQYDHVFNVDVGDGEPIRKLPYNRSDIPYDTADKWVAKENLPLSYRQQVEKFILQNTGQRDFTLGASFRDHTGDTSANPAFKHIPKKGMPVFDAAARFDGILKKVSEFNNILISDTDKKNLSLNELEVSRLGAIVKILKDTSHYHTSTFSDADVTLLLKLINSWPLAMIFPVVDIMRMFVLHPDGSNRLLKHVDHDNVVLLEMIKNITASPIPANLLTSIRAITNLFKTPLYYQWLQKHCSEILDAFSSHYSSSNKNVQLSYATLILNYAVLLAEKQDEEGQSQVLSAALEIAEDENLDVDSRFRALVAIGSLMLDGLVRKIALDFDVEKIAKTAKDSKDSKLAEIGADIELLIKHTCIVVKG